MINLFETIKKPFVIKRLKKEYKMLYASNAAEAERSLQRQMKYLKAKHPG
jgi:hypothetical protein